MLRTKNINSININNIDLSKNNIPQFNDFMNIQSSLYNDMYYKFQNEILLMKKFIYYLMLKKGIPDKDVFNDFPEAFLKNILGVDYNKIQ